MKKTLMTLALAITTLTSLAKGKPNITQASTFMQQTKSLFEENKGQVTGTDASKVNYVYKEEGLSVFLLKTGIAYQFTNLHYPEGYKAVDKFAKREEQELQEKLKAKISTETYRMDVNLVGANSNAHIKTEGKSEDYTQYYNCSALDVHSYSKITYHDIYPHIDWVIYKTDSKVKYDFVVHPGGNPDDIQLQTNWVEETTLNKDGSLSLRNRMGSITEQTPISYQNNKESQVYHRVLKITN